MSQDTTIKLLSKNKWMTAKQLYDKQQSQEINSIRMNLKKLANNGFIQKRIIQNSKGLPTNQYRRND